MKICVAGLGLIGGSIALSLKRAGYSVDGYNRSPEPLKYALDNGVIDNAAQKFDGYDLVFVALPPEACLDFICRTSFKKGAIVADICGVKGFLQDAVLAKPRDFYYVGCHPMAGKEVSGVYNACADLFDGANMILIRYEGINKTAFETLKRLSFEMGFGTVVVCTADAHDKKIAYTSQLAHVVANAYVRDGQLAGCTGFTGGSFQDMTRIAGVDEKVWSSLYLANAANLAERIDNIVAALNDLKSAILSGDKTALEKTLCIGKDRHLSGQKDEPQEGIEVIRRDGR